MPERRRPNYRRRQPDQNHGRTSSAPRVESLADARRLLQENSHPGNEEGIVIIAGQALENKPRDRERAENGLSRRLTDYSRIYFQLRKHFGKLSGRTVVHLASGPGIFTPFLEKIERANAVSLDMNSLYLKFAKFMSESKGVRANAERLPFRTGSVDALVSDQFLFANYPYINEENIFAEARRVLRPNGLLVLERSVDVPTNPSGEPKVHLAKEVIEGYGFELVEYSPPSEVPRMLSDQRSSLYVLRKKA